MDRHSLIAGFIMFLLNISCMSCSPLEYGEAQAGQMSEPPPTGMVMSFTMPTNDRHLNDMNVIVDLSAFGTCQKEECFTTCSTKNPKLAYCDPKNPRLCMCTFENFYTSDLEGPVIPVDRTNNVHKNCSVACNKRKSYARIWNKVDKSLTCLCLMNQITSTGITICDVFAVSDVCKAICQSDMGVCTFNGVCVCRKNWDSVFNLALPNIRKEVKEDLNQCSQRCSSYHHDYVARIYDSKMDSKTKEAYEFRDKFCVCGREIDLTSKPPSKAIVDEGFQLCTGLKCKQRCGMDEAVCEAVYRRACLCPRENILIGKHLWSRLPAHGELKCQETCMKHGKDARVIEWNPFLEVEGQQFDPSYRKSEFQYHYEGKFCHCITVQMDMHQYRPCTEEHCRIICGHHSAECDKRTRRACICNTHQLNTGLGRRPDPGEINCDVACRYGLSDGRILDVTWEIPVEHWGVKISKYCACIRPVSAAGLTHCDTFKDECPKYCGHPNAYCTREKYCHCGVVTNILKNPLIRLGNGKEQDECGELCRSWMWPIAEDTDNMPYIYDESFGDCSATSTTDPCPIIDTSPWKRSKPGAPVIKDACEEIGTVGERKFCLCAKSSATMYKPGTRFLMHLEPVRIPKTQPCALNHTCVAVGTGVHIIK